jgi:hypothetical protein
MIQRSYISAALLFASTLLPVASAQLPQLRLNAVYPQGGAVASTFRVAVTESTDADELAEMLFSDPGITAVPAKNEAGTVIANTFDVTVSKTVKPGYYEVRLRGLFGISNSRLFRVDTLPETGEVEPNNVDDLAQPATMNQIVNARADVAGDVDIYKVPIAAGQTITIRTEAARIDSLMQPVIQVLDDAGRRIKKARRILDRDASVVVTSERDQTLTVRVHDVVFGGGQAYSYRLTLDTRPLVDFVWPPVVPEGSQSAVVLYGRHLPEGEPTDLEIDGTRLYRQPHIVDVIASTGPSTGSSPDAASVNTHWWNGIDGNLLKLAVCRSGIPIYRDSAPIVADGHQLTGAFTVAGRFRRRGQDVTIRFSAKQGEVRDIEVLSQRLGVPANSILYVEQITNAEDGSETVKLLATEVDGRQDPGAKQLPTFTTDSAWRLTAPADGVYQIRVRDRFAGAKASPDRYFIVDVRTPESGYELIAFESIASADGALPVTTGAVSIRRGGHYELPVYVIRDGGHSAAITVTAVNLPAGVTCRPAVIPPGKSGIKLLLQAAEDAVETTGPIKIVGTSGDKTRESHVATLLHGGVNGLPRTGRLTHALMLNVMKDNQPFTVKFGLGEVVVHQDQQLLIPVTLERRDGFNGKVDLAFAGQPANVDVPAVSFAPDVGAATARLFFKENATVGPTQLVAYATGPVKYRRNPWLAERAHDTVAEVQKKVEEQQKQVAAATTVMESVNAEVKTTVAAIETLKQQLTTGQTEIAQIKEKITLATGEQGTAVAAIKKVQQAQLTAAATVETTDIPLDALTAASKELESAAAALSRVTTEITRQTNQLRMAMEHARSNVEQQVSAQAGLVSLQEKLKQAEDMVTAAQQKQEQLTAAKTKADEAAKAADEATKAKDVTVRSVATTIQLDVFATPGKITAAVPGDGVIKRGTSIEVPVTIVRKNKFAAAVDVSLMVADASGVSAPAINIPADQTQGTITIAASAEAAVADLANAVIRATTSDFMGRSASFDVPVTLKVVE